MTELSILNFNLKKNCYFRSLKLGLLKLRKKNTLEDFMEFRRHRTVSDDRKLVFK